MPVYYKFKHYFRRWQYQAKARVSPLKPLYCPPEISESTLCLNTRFLVLDCEMSGLSVKNHELLSLGWVEVEHGKILNSSAQQLLIRPKNGVGRSVVIHGMDDQSLVGADSIQECMLQLIDKVPGAILVFHHAHIDLQFLQKASRELFQVPLLLSYLDTMEIEQKRLQLRGKTGGLRLHQCRERYGLPVTAQHNAKADAIATAELFLAQIHHMGDFNSLKIAQLPIRCS